MVSRANYKIDANLILWMIICNYATSAEKVTHKAMFVRPRRCGLGLNMQNMSQLTPVDDADTR